MRLLSRRVYQSHDDGTMTSNLASTLPQLSLKLLRLAFKYHATGSLDSMNCLCTNIPDHTFSSTSIKSSPFNLLAKAM